MGDGNLVGVMVGMGGMGGSATTASGVGVGTAVVAVGRGKRAVGEGGRGVGGRGTAVQAINQPQRKIPTSHLYTGISLAPQGIPHNKRAKLHKLKTPYLWLLYPPNHEVSLCMNRSGLSGSICLTSC